MKNWSERIHDSVVRLSTIMKKIALQERIRLIFHYVGIQRTASCTDDSLAIYDGSSEGSDLVARMCGSGVPDPYISSENSVFLRFQSDDADTLGGFLIEYTQVSGTTQQTGKTS